MARQERISTPNGDTFKPGEEYWPQPTAPNSKSSGEFPLLEGRTSEELHTIARGIGRTTHTGRRGIAGTPITSEGEIVAEMMKRNEWRSRQEGGENG